jgi:predicted metal-binding protein
MEIARVIPRDDDDYEPRLKKALDELCELALEEGAHECAVIECEDLVIKEISSDIPDVPVEDRSIFWPQVCFPKDSIQDAIWQYSWAVVFRLDVDGEESSEEGGGDGASPARRYSLQAADEQVFRIAGRVESASFYKGFYLAMGLAAGNCKDVFCKTEKKCQALTVGKSCRHPLKPRPSLEACGLDLRDIAERAGWKDLDEGTFLMGMVFID